MSVHDEQVLRLAAKMQRHAADLEKLLTDERNAATRAASLDAAVMAACKEVGRASDLLAQAQFAGSVEAVARRRLEQAAKVLASAMRRRETGGAA